MASFDDDADAAGNSQDEFENENEDEEMEDQDQDQDQDQGQDDEGGDEDEDEDNDDNDNDNDDDADEDEDQNEPDTPSRRVSQHISNQRPQSLERQQINPAVVLTSPSPRSRTARSPSGAAPPPSSFIPPMRPEALTAQAYDIVPTMAAPQSTSINAVAATPDMHWVFSGGSDGYVRMFNWVETANGKVPLTVAQKHPFVDSVMKAGSLLTYWENEEAGSSSAGMKTPPADEGKWTSPVYSLAVQHQAIWLLSGLESGGINLQTCRHQAGSRITTLKEHTSAVSVLTLSQDETNVLSGSWDKTIHDWDLQAGRVKRSFRGSGGQISTIETRPMSDVPVPEVSEAMPEPFDGTFSSNNADRPLTNGVFSDRRDSRGGEEDAMGSPSGSLFGEGDHGSLFGEDTAPVGGGNAFADDEDELTRALADGLQEAEQDEQDTEMTGMGGGGPVQPPEPAGKSPEADATVALLNCESTIQSDESQYPPEETAADTTTATVPIINGLPHSHEPITAPPTDESSRTADLPPQSESTFLDAAITGTLRIWDRRVSSPVATVLPYGGTPPWCMSACWSPDGNAIYAGRRNCTVDEYSIHKLGSNMGKPNRVFRFQQGSGPVYAVKGMPNGRHLVWYIIPRSSPLPTFHLTDTMVQRLPRHPPDLRPPAIRFGTPPYRPLHHHPRPPRRRHLRCTYRPCVQVHAVRCGQQGLGEHGGYRGPARV